jgi:hypothetical protein
MLNVRLPNTFSKSPIETLIPPTPASPGSPGAISLQAKSYLSNDPALVVLYRQLRERTLQTLKGAVKVPGREEWNFVLRNARLYDRMGCDLLALNLVREWEFLRPLPAVKMLPSRLSLSFTEEAPDPRRLLKRRSSLVVADMPLSPVFHEDLRSPINARTGAHPPPTVFEEPDSNSLLDSFGF